MRAPPQEHESDRPPAWRRYLRFWRADAVADVAEELRFHIESAVAESMAAGMTAAEARAEAVRRFGDVQAIQQTLNTLTHERERTMAWSDRLHACISDLRVAIRQLRANPGFACVAVLTLGLGIGANSAVFSVVDAVMFRPLPYADADRLVMVGEGLPVIGGDNFGTITTPDYLDYAKLTPQVFASTAAFQSYPATLAGPGGAERLNGIQATPSLMRVLGLRPAVGSDFASDAASPGSPDVAILSNGLWRRTYGADPSVVGRVILLDGVPTRVVGIAPPSFVFPLPGLHVAAADFVVPLRITAAVLQSRGDGFRTFVIGRLAPNVTLATARTAVQTVATRMSVTYPDVFGGKNRVTADVVTLRDRLVGSTRRALLVLLAAVGVVLLIACLNVCGLLMARAAAREREIAVRGALGASRGRLLQQFLMESALLVVAGSGAGLLAAHWGVHALAGAAPAGLLDGYDPVIDFRVMLLTFGVSAAAVFVFASLPAVSGGSRALAIKLRGDGRGLSPGRSRQRGRRVLVITEFALALILSSAAGLLVRSFANALRVNPGFRAEGLLSFQIPLPRERYADSASVLLAESRLVQRLETVPGVTQASAAIQLPTEARWQTAISPEGIALPHVPLVTNNAIMPGYFAALGIPLLHGRGFSAHDANGSGQVAIVDEEFARRYFPDGRALGRRIKWGAPEGNMPWATIVGIVRPVTARTLDEQPMAAAYFPLLQVGNVSGMMELGARSLMYVVRTSGDPLALTRDIRRAVADIDPSLPVARVATGDDLISGALAARRFNMLLLSVFGALALILSAVGIYGLVGCTVVERNREIGVRLAIGSSPAAVLRLIVADGCWTGAIGLAIGLVATFAIAPLMRSLLYDVPAIDPWTFGAACAVLFAVAVIASWFPARRASRVDPLTSLKA